jgi:hypothetical protein
VKPNLVQRHSRFKVHSILTIPAILYGCEIWTLEQRGTRRLKTAEMKYMRRTARCILLDVGINGDFWNNVKWFEPKN